MQAMLGAGKRQKTPTDMPDQQSHRIDLPTQSCNARKPTDTRIDSENALTCATRSYNEPCVGLQTVSIAVWKNFMRRSLKPLRVNASVPNIHKVRIENHTPPMLARTSAQTQSNTNHRPIRRAGDQPTTTDYSTQATNHSYYHLQTSTANDSFIT